MHHKRVHFRAHQVQLLQALQSDDMPFRNEFAIHVLQAICVDAEFLQRIIFTDEANFHLSGKVNRHNLRIWGSEKSHRIIRNHPWQSKSM